MSFIYNLFFITLFSVLLSSCAKTPMAVTNKIDTIITIDGSANEWRNSFEYDKTSKFQYSINSDEKNLFVCVKITNQELETKIKKYGLTLWIDSTGKNKQQLGIKYPIGSKNQMSKEMKKDFRMQSEKDKLEERSAFLSGTNELEVKGFRILQDLGNEFFRTDSKSRIGIHAALGYDTTNAMIYELKVPLSLIYSEGKRQASNLGITFLTGSMDMKEREENFEDTNKPGSVQTGMAGYATGTQQNMPKSPQYLNMIEPTELKLKISIQ